MIWGFLEESLHHRIPPKWSLEPPAASTLILGGAPRVLLDPLKINENTKTNQTIEKWKLENPAICEDVHQKIIEIGLVEILST